MIDGPMIEPHDRPLMIDEAERLRRWRLLVGPDQVVDGHPQGARNRRQLLSRRPGRILVLDLPDVALRRTSILRELIKGQTLLRSQVLDSPSNFHSRPFCSIRLFAFGVAIF